MNAIIVGGMLLWCLPRGELGITLARISAGVEWRETMNRRISFLAVVLAVAGILTVRGAFSQPTPQATRKVIKMAGGPITAPFSDAILVGNTLYLAGRIGIDPKTGKVPEKIEDEAKVLLDSEKEVLAQAGMTMDDLGTCKSHARTCRWSRNSIPITRAISRQKTIPRGNAKGRGRCRPGGTSDC